MDLAGRAGKRRRLMDGRSRQRGLQRVCMAKMAVRLGPVPAGNRDVELGIAPHSVLVDVEAAGLDLRVDADSPRQLQGEKEEERGAERERAYCGQPECLDAELVEATAVEKTLGAGREALRLRRKGEQPQGQGAPDACHAVGGNSADGVVD